MRVPPNVRLFQIGVDPLSQIATAPKRHELGEALYPRDDAKARADFFRDPGE